MFKQLTLALILGIFCTGSLRAQSEGELLQAFSGTWYVFEPSQGQAPDICEIELGRRISSDAYPVTLRNCAGSLMGVSYWRIQNGQITLLDAAGAQVATLGGNQTRLTGKLASNGSGLIVERSETPEAKALNDAIRRYRCVFLGYSSTCAKPTDLEGPTFLDDDSSPEILLLVDLNARSQPRTNASLLGVIPRNTPIVVDECLTAADGIWCSATFGDQTGWLAKTVVRKKTWPVVTFANK